MNPQSESNSALNPNESIIEGEIIETHENYQENEGVDLNIIHLQGDFSENIDAEPLISLKLTPWGIGAIALFLFSNLLLTWAQFTQNPSLETSQNPIDIPIFPEDELSITSEEEINPDNLSILPKPVKTPSVVPSTPQTTTTAKVPTPPKPPQPTLSEQILPPSLRPQTITVKQQIAPPPVVPVSIASRNQPPEPVSVPPTVQPEPVATPLPPEPPEISKEEQLRNILRQQIIREEAENQPPLTFKQRYQQEMLDKKLREYRAQEAAQKAAAASNNAVSSPPPQPQSPAIVPPAPPVSSPTVQSQPQNVNQLVNQLESFNQK